jgi:hypothetical protein
MIRVSARRAAITPCLVILLLAQAAPSASAASASLAHGRSGAVVWKLGVSSRAIASARLPALCVNFLWAWGPGQLLGNGFPTCVAPASGHDSRSGDVRWTFDLHAGGYHGVVPLAYGGAAGSSTIRGVVVLADPRARRVVATLQDGETLRLRTRVLPAQLHRAARIAWTIGSGRGSASSLKFRKVRAYDVRGRIVGSFK